MATCISALTSLMSLSIGFKSPASHPDPTNPGPPPLTHAVLPALTNFAFHAPLLHVTQITFFNQLVFGIQQLSRFIGHAPALKPYGEAIITFHLNTVVIAFSSRSQSSPDCLLKFQISGREINRQVLIVVQICNQLSESFIMSSTTHLRIRELTCDVSPWVLISQDPLDETQWLKFFHLFTAVWAVYIEFEKVDSRILSVLRGFSRESATQVLPAMEKLHIENWTFGFEQVDTWPFIIARQHSDHPISVHRWERRI
jgi:hypothetical protein